MFNKLNNLNLIFILTLIMSTLLGISCSSWLIIWVAMEINVMSFIPLMMKINHMKTSESMMLYFLVQSVSSLNMLMMILMNNLNYFWYLTTYLNKIFLINILLLMKMGAAPFYFWFPKVMKEISWMNNYLLMTWQKIIPMTLIYYFMSKIMIYSSIVLSVIMGSIMAFNQTNLKMIMAFSSINHMGWLMTTLTLNMIIWIIYLLNYFMLNFIICKMFNMMNLKYLMNIFIMNYPPLLKIMLLINFFSLGGIPPFLGFLPKWMTIMTLMYTKSYLIMIILITTTLINLFFYLRLMIPTLILSSTQIKFTLYNNKFNNFNLINLIFLSFMNLLIMMFLTLIYHLI